MNKSNGARTCGSSRTPLFSSECHSIGVNPTISQILPPRSVISMHLGGSTITGSNLSTGIAERIVSRMNAWGPWSSC